MEISGRKKAKASRGKGQGLGGGIAGDTTRISDRTWVVIIFGCGIAVRFIYLFQIEAIPLFYHLAGDGRTYDEWAQRLASGDWLGKGVFYQPPLYPYFLGLLQAMVGHDFWLIRIIQIALGALSCVLIFRAGCRLFSRQVGIVSGLILAFYAPAIFFGGLIEKSILDLFLLSILLWLIARSIEQPLRTRWLTIGASLGLLGLSRENALILAFVVPAWVGVYFSQVPLARRLEWVALFFAGLLFVLIPVGMRNLAMGGEFKLTTSQFGANFFIGNNPAADGTYNSVRNIIREPQLEGVDATRLAERARGRKLTAGEVSSYWYRQSADYIRSQPGHWLQLLARKWLLVWNAREIEDSDDYYIYQQWSWLLRFLGWVSHFGTLLPLAVVGLWLTSGQWRRLGLFYAMILSLAISIAAFYVFGRYRFPLVPLLALFAGAGVVRLAVLYQQRAWRSMIVAILILAFAGVVANWPIHGTTGPGAAGYNNLSNAYYKQGRINQAIQMAQKAIELQPDYGVARYNLGNLYAARGEFDAAQAQFAEALRVYPNFADAHSNFGQLIAERGDIASSVPYFRKAIELNPSLSRAHLNLGVALAKLGRTAEAVNPLREAVRLAPDSADAHFYLGSVYAALGRYEEAEIYFSGAVRIRYGFVEAHQSLAQVFSLQGKKELALRHHEEALRLLRRQGGAAGSR